MQRPHTRQHLQRAVSSATLGGAARCGADVVRRALLEPLQRRVDEREVGVVARARRDELACDGAAIGGNGGARVRPLAAEPADLHRDGRLRRDAALERQADEPPQVLLDARGRLLRGGRSGCRRHQAGRANERRRRRVAPRARAASGHKSGAPRGGARAGGQQRAPRRAGVRAAERHVKRGVRVVELVLGVHWGCRGCDPRAPHGIETGTRVDSVPGTPYTPVPRYQ